MAAALEGTTKLAGLDARIAEANARLHEREHVYATREASEREASTSLGLAQDQLAAAKSKLEMQTKEDELEKTNLTTNNEVRRTGLEWTQADPERTRSGPGADPERTRAGNARSSTARALLHEQHTVRIHNCKYYFLKC